MTTEPVIRLGVPALEMRGVSVDSPNDRNTQVATGVNWTVNPGEFWVLGGAQRSGKTDFLMMAGGLTAPSAGNYRFFGLDMPISDDEQLVERLKLGFVFDGGQLFNRLTVAENVTLPLRYHRDLTRDAALAEVQALLEGLGLERTVKSRPATLGRGFQQRVGLARALALQPEVLMLDTPLSGLDTQHTIWWLNMLNELWRGHTLMKGRPMTLVVTTDDLRPWQAEGRHFACLSAERLLVLGGWNEVERCPDAAVHDLLRERHGGH